MYMSHELCTCLCLQGKQACCRGSLERALRSVEKIMGSFKRFLGSVERVLGSFDMPGGGIHDF